MEEATLAESATHLALTPVLAQRFTPAVFAVLSHDVVHASPAVIPVTPRALTMVSDVIAWNSSAVSLTP